MTSNSVAVGCILGESTEFSWYMGNEPMLGKLHRQTDQSRKGRCMPPDFGLLFGNVFVSEVGKCMFYV